MNRIRGLFVDGVLLALPLGGAAYLLHKVIGLLARLLAPVAHLLPEGRWFGIAALEVAAFGLLVLVLLVLGLFARSAAGKRLRAALEEVVMSKIPGYAVVKAVAADFVTTERHSPVSPALVRFDDNTVMGFIVEKSADGGLCTVFVPTAPGAASGKVVLVPPERVQPLEVSIASAKKAMELRGIGLQQLATPRRG